MKKKENGEKKEKTGSFGGKRWEEGISFERGRRKGFIFAIIVLSRK